MGLVCFWEHVAAEIENLHATLNNLAYKLMSLLSQAHYKLQMTFSALKEHISMRLEYFCNVIWKFYFHLCL